MLCFTVPKQAQRATISAAVIQTMLLTAKNDALSQSCSKSNEPA